MSGRNSFQNAAANPTASSSSLVSALALAADPPTRLMDGPAMDYFLIELVNTLRASSVVATARAKKIEQEMIGAGLIPTPTAVPPALKRDSQRDSMASSISRASAGKASVDEDDEELRARLETIGHHVGANIAER